MLAYHAIPTDDSKRRSALEDQQSPFQRRSDDEVIEAARSREPFRRSCVNNKTNQDRDESPSRIAFRNLEESWKRFELESTASPPTPTAGLPAPRAVSPSSSSLSRPPYRELIECASLNESTAKNNRVKEAAVLQDEANAPACGTTPVAKDSSNQTSDNNLDSHSSCGDTSSKTESSSSSSLSPTKLASEAASTESTSSRAPAISYKSASDFFQQQQHLDLSHKGPKSTFLATEEARHILDLPSLLGKDPNMIPDVLAMPTPLHAPHRSNKDRPASAPLTATEGQPDGEQENDSSSSRAKLISELDSKAEATAKAMTERYSAKNLNMTETEAHRMVQLMAAEIVALHEQREAMLQKMEQAKQEMMEAARLLRMRAAETQINDDGSAERGMQDSSQSESNKQRQSVLSATGNEALLQANARHDWDGEAKEQVKEVEEEEGERRRLNASVYDKDEWRR